MRKKLTTAETGLPDYVLEFVAKRKEEGFSYFEKSPRQSHEDACGSDGKWYPLDERGIQLADGERWFIRYDNGRGEDAFTICSVHPIPTDEEFEASISSPETAAEIKRLNQKFANAKRKNPIKSSPPITDDSQDYIRHQIHLNKARSQMAEYVFTTNEGELVQITSNRIFVENHLEQWRDRDEAKHLERTSIKEATSAGFAHDQLAAAITELDQAGAGISPLLWRVIERAFRAGKHAAAFDHREAVSNAATDASMRRNRGQDGKARQPRDPKRWQLEVAKVAHRDDATPANLFDKFLGAGWIIKHPNLDKFHFSGDKKFVKRKSIEQKIRRELDKN